MTNSKRMKVNKDESTNWIDRFIPQNTGELAVHVKKIEEVEFWLKTCPKNKPKILLLVGPPGCGKTICLKTLARDLGFDLLEWISPIDQDFARDFQSQKEKFSEFLLKSSRYNSLFTTKRRLLLVEDFPNIIIDQKQLLWDIIGQFKITGKSPLVFIATETKSKTMNIAYNLFPDNVLSEFGIHQIAFNPIPNTAMKKALQQILGKIKTVKEFEDGFKEPSSDVLESIIVSSQGDIRNAVLNLQFVSQKNLPKVELETVTEVSNKDMTRKRAKRVNDNSKLKEIGRDETISLMHGIGRVFNPKLDANQKLTHSPEFLTDLFSTQPNNFISFMFSNYAAHFSNIENCIENLNILTKSDVMLHEYRDAHLATTALNMAIRGAMVSNDSPVSGFIPVKKHKIDKTTEIQSQEDYTQFIKSSLEPLISKNTYILDMKSAIKSVGKNLKAAEETMEIEDEQFVIEEYCSDND